MRIGSRGRVVGLIAGAAACLLAAGGAGAAATKHTARQVATRPNLRIGHTDIALAAGKLTGTIAVRNSGGPALKSTVGITYRLRAHTVRIRMKNIAAPAIAAGKRAVLRLDATFPSHAPGVYVVEACADPEHRILESNEADNCKHIVHVTVAASGVVTAVQPAPAAAPADDSTDTADPSDGLTDDPVDTTPPDTIIDSAPSGSVSDSPQTITFHASEAGATLECRLDGGLWATCASPQTVPSLAGGSHTFEVRASDAAGNVDPTPAQAIWTTIDTTPPRTTIDSGPPDSPDTNAKFVFHSSEPATFKCRLDTTPLGWTPCTSPYQINVTTGPHILEVQATDAFGNVEPAPAAWRWRVA